jgi:hypothetical protein
MTKTFEIAILLIAAVTVFISVTVFVFKKPTIQPIGCTMEAKVCPDGTAVGRTGPKCEFTECPPFTPDSGEKESITLNARLGETITGLGVSITPMAITEDSRCPVDVTCIQAGRVVLKLNISSGLGDSEMPITLNGTPITTEAEQIKLVEVLPIPNSKITIRPTDYIFKFKISKRDGVEEISGKNGILVGQVTLSPICPVERIPPQPECAPKPYQTSVNVTKGSDNTAIATQNSDANGYFRFSIPSGTYNISAGPKNTMPSCPKSTATVKGGTTTTVNISCDTGIR